LFDLIAFDADDTLWHNESLYSKAQAEFGALLAPYAAEETIQQRLYETEMRNLEHYGYGIKGFTLSMIESAVALTEGKIQGSEVLQIIDFAKEMLTAEVQLFEHVEETLHELAQSQRLIVITKGDLRDQKSKLSRSGIAHHFQHVEVVSDKTQETYKALLKKHSVEPRKFLMVGNSLRSDILPVLALGGHGAYIPYHITWVHETVENQPDGHDGFYQLEHLGQLPALLDHISRSQALPPG
jgi:putative hydrolase of the HAD superfamily